MIYVARQLGHGAELTLRTYGHVIEELEDSPQLPAEEAIRRAREHIGGGEMYPFCTRERRTGEGLSRRIRLCRATPRPGLEPGAYSLGGSPSINLPALFPLGLTCKID